MLDVCVRVSVFFAAVTVSACSTLPPAAGLPAALPFSIDAGASVAVVGDLQMTPWIVRALRRSEYNRAAQGELIEDLRSHSSGFGALIVVGDLVFTPRSRRQWRHFDRLIGPIAESLPVLPAMGNHDYNCFLVQICSQRSIPKNVVARFPWLRPGQPYWLSYGDVALLFVDSETDLPEQEAWLRSRLPEFQQRYKGLLVFSHRPPFTDSSIARLALGHQGLKRHVVEPLIASGIPFAFISGHVHGYEHLDIDGAHFIVSGGGGGPRRRLLPQRRYDVYAGRDCARDDVGAVIRPFNYLVIDRQGAGVAVSVRGFCKGDAAIEVLESFVIAFSRDPIDATSFLE